MYMQFIYTNKEGITAEKNVRGISAKKHIYKLSI